MTPSTSLSTGPTRDQGDANASTIAPRLLAWFEAHGRKGFPWQHDPTPYRVWVSEVMLQQTQAATVAPYLLRFMSSFPTIEALAAAALDEVLHVWTGLGYYARARNLHRAARIVVECHAGRLPGDIDVLRRLPGIGRSTAGAILALSCGRRHPILDGNARRVLARYFGVEGRAGAPETERALWALAAACTPRDGMAEYTQAIMDLGATLCRRARPDCDACPLRDGCMALATGRQADLPAPRLSRARPHRASVMLLVTREDGAVLLEERPPTGLWGGLFSLPMFETADEATAWLARHFGEACGPFEVLAPYEHAFTHFDLTLSPLLARVAATNGNIAGHRWYHPGSGDRIGLSKPARDLAVLASTRHGR